MGLKYNEYLNSIDVGATKNEHGVLFHLTGRRPLQEFHLEFIFELSLISGNIYRAYTVLPRFNPQLTGSGFNSRPIIEEPRAARVSPPTRKEPFRFVAVPGNRTGDYAAGEYVVQSLDSVSEIAERMDRSLGNIYRRMALLIAATRY